MQGKANQTNVELWKKYKKTHSPAIKEQLIIEYSNIIKYVAGRLSIYFGSNVEYDDLVGYGVFGLIDAIDKYDLEKGVKFETYASLRIRGSIIDSIRDMDWVPRTLRKKSKEIEKAYSAIETELGRVATDEEVSQKLGITKDELNKVLHEVNMTSLLSLEDYLDQNYEISLDSSSTGLDEIPEKNLEATEIKDILADTIDTLPDKERLVVSLYYFDELTLKEISAILKVSESRVSQLHTKAVMRLRGKLEKHRSLMTGAG